MLVMPDLKEEIQHKQKKIDKQKYQITELQKDLQLMFLRIKELNARLVEEQKQQV
jgi:peptidoglycan hydrolase CwlO-like protein